MRLSKQGSRTSARMLPLAVSAALLLLLNADLVQGQVIQYQAGGPPGYIDNVPQAVAPQTTRGAGFSYVAGYARPGDIGYFGPGANQAAYYGYGEWPAVGGFGYPGYRFGPPGYRYGLPVYGDPYGTLLPPPYDGGFVFPGFGVGIGVGGERAPFGFR